MSTIKKYGQFFTPNDVARTLVKWAVRHKNDRILDPSCGNGEFLTCHPYSVGIEIDSSYAPIARERSKASLVHEADFFTWASKTQERFDAVVGNPPFIRYQGFSGETRRRALELAKRAGANLPKLSSSWAPFIAASMNLLRRNGRLAVVVPAEIGHATYAAPLLYALAENFELVHIVAIRKKIFPQLSEDAWLLCADGFGAKSNYINFTLLDCFKSFYTLPPPTHIISVEDLRQVNGRLRRWLLPSATRLLYESLEDSTATYRLGSVANISIGYVSGANEFFHLRPSQARKLRIPDNFLRVAVRRGEYLPLSASLTKRHVKEWILRDEPVLLLHIERDNRLPKSIKRYLSSDMAEKAKSAYKCRIREPWYTVPNVVVPDVFLSYMSGIRPNLVKNSCKCVGTNSVHSINLKNKRSFMNLYEKWNSPLTTLSCEVEGHPLGGGMLKIEPGEARRIILPKENCKYNENTKRQIENGILIMREWRHNNLTVQEHACN